MHQWLYELCQSSSLRLSLVILCAMICDKDLISMDTLFSALFTVD